MTHEQYMKLARGSHLMPFIVFIPVGLAHLYYAVAIQNAPWQYVALFSVIGFFGWGLSEYLLHRFPFHYTNAPNEFIRFFTSGFHMLHHKVPQSSEYIVAPIYLALWGHFLAMCGFFLFTWGNWMIINLLGVGFAIGYMYYEWVHYLTHHHNPKSQYYKDLKDYHLIHHFKDPKNNFGVSYKMWDYIFRTVSKKTLGKAS